MGGGDQERVDFIEVKTISKRRQIQRIGFTTAIKDDREDHAGERCAHRHSGHQPARFCFTGQLDKDSRDEIQTSPGGGQSQKNQRPDHHPRRFPSGAGVVAARPAEENHDHETQHVERGQKCREKCEPTDRRIFSVSEREDSVFAEESAKRGEADQRERADHESEKGDAEAPGEPAHFPDVLLVMEHDDD